MRKLLSLLLFHKGIEDQQLDMFNILVISLIWISMVILVNPIGDFPLNDDWVYALAVKSILENGYYQFPSPSSANVGPQVFWGALFCLPFGFSFTALRVSSLTLALLGVITFYKLIRSFGPHPRIALVGALSLGVNPLYFGLANTFMTDIPFISLVMLALYFLLRGLNREARSDIYLGLVITFATILVRQVALVILLGFAVAYVLKYGFKFGNIAKVTVLVTVGAFLHIGYQYWLVNTGRTPLLSGHSDIKKLIPNSDSAWAMRQAAINILIYTGFFTLPFVVLYIHYKPINVGNVTLRSIRISLVAFAVLFFGIILWTGNILPSLPNVLTKFGLGPLTLRDTYIVYLNNRIAPQILTIFWNAITISAVAALTAVIYFVSVGFFQIFFKRGKIKSSAQTWEFSFFIVMVAVYFLILVFIAGTTLIFDRYLLLFLPLVILLILNVKLEFLWPVPRRGVVLSRVLIALFAGFSIASTHDYLEWNRARWKVLHNLIDVSKVHANQIDGGYEFNGWYLYDAKYKQKPGKSWWWVEDDQYIVTSGPLPGYTELRRYTFNRWLLPGEGSILVLHKNRIGD